MGFVCVLCCQVCFWLVLQGRVGAPSDVGSRVLVFGGFGVFGVWSFWWVWSFLVEFDEFGAAFMWCWISGPFWTACGAWIGSFVWIAGGVAFVFCLLGVQLAFFGVVEG